MVPALLEAGFTVTTIGRPGGRAAQQGRFKNVTAREAALDDEDGLTAILQGQDALVGALNPAATTYQRTIVRAALSAGIKHFITNEFGTDTFHPNMSSLPAGQAKAEAQRVLEEELEAAAVGGKKALFSWTGIFTGPWFDWSIKMGIFWINPTTRTITRNGSGDQKVSVSRAALTGEAVVVVLQNPKQFHNRPAYFANHTVSTNELITLVNKISNEPERPWNIVEVPDVESVRLEGVRQWHEDRKNGVEDWLHSQAFGTLIGASFFDEENRFGADFSSKAEPGFDEGHEKLKEQLKELIKEADKAV